MRSRFHALPKVLIIAVVDWLDRRAARRLVIASKAVHALIGPLLAPRDYPLVVSFANSSYKSHLRLRRGVTIANTFQTIVLNACAGKNAIESYPKMRACVVTHSCGVCQPEQKKMLESQHIHTLDYHAYRFPTDLCMPSLTSIATNTSLRTHSLIATFPRLTTLVADIRASDIVCLRSVAPQLTSLSLELAYSTIDNWKDIVFPAVTLFALSSADSYYIPRSHFPALKKFECVYTGDDSGGMACAIGTTTAEYSSWRPIGLESVAFGAALTSLTVGDAENLPDLFQFIRQARLVSLHLGEMGTPLPILHHESLRGLETLSIDLGRAKFHSLEIPKTMDRLTRLSILDIADPLQLSIRSASVRYLILEGYVPHELIQFTNVMRRITWVTMRIKVVYVEWLRRQFPNLATLECVEAIPKVYEAVGAWDPTVLLWSRDPPIGT